MKRRSVRILVFTVVPLVLIISILAGLTWRQVRQDRLNQTLVAAIKMQDYPAALRALQQGADARARDLPPDSRPFWQRLFNIMYNRSQTVSSDSETALHLMVDNIEQEPQGAWETASPAVVRALLHGGADPSERDREQLPLCFEVAFAGSVDEVKAFLEHEDPFDVQSSEARECLIGSLANPHRGVTALLLDRGMNPNITDGYGWSLLTDAACFGNREVVQLLLDRGVSTTTRDKDRMNALERAELRRKRMLDDGATEQDKSVKSLEAVIALLKARGAKSR